MASRGAKEGGIVGLMFRFWRIEDLSMGFASNSFLFIPNPTTSNPSASPSSFPAIANCSISEGKWLIQLEHRSSIRPLRGKFAS